MTHQNLTRAHLDEFRRATELAFTDEVQGEVKRVGRARASALLKFHHGA